MQDQFVEPKQIEIKVEEDVLLIAVELANLGTENAERPVCRCKRTTIAYESSATRMLEHALINSHC